MGNSQPLQICIFSLPVPIEDSVFQLDSKHFPIYFWD